MARYIIEGGNKLSGKVRISGNKNSVFPVLAACLLTDQEVVLGNIPQNADTSVSIEIFKELGIEVGWRGQDLLIKADKVTTHVLPRDLTRKLRGSIVLVGGVLGRLGKVEFTHPGGDLIGRRGVGLHIEGLHQLGYGYEINDLEYKLFGNNLKGDVEYFLDLASVTATEILILTSVLREGKTVLKNCAKEPHVQDLCRMLISMGAELIGVDESTILITGVKRLRGTNFRISSDYIEAGSYAIAAVITGGDVEIENFSLKSMEPVIRPLGRMGLRFKEGKTSVKVWADKLVAHPEDPKLITNFWPGFPTDMVSISIVLATQAKGMSLIHDWLYESRMFFVDKLIAMGAHITIADPHRVVVYGPSELHGRNLETPDIRAGMALVLAALVAKGESTINRAELIERGYEDVVGKLSSLGAKIQRLD